ncbi:PA14 domain protein [Stieleria neptunia]|uniref:PA14 domain protein n=1 Tax=Stieleria neptunia TaxID=2527979 RepID=A0A518HJ23_9BACT|nr:PA14 domain-containing protein [Stieleria neptunia]QDV40809.1 PA14 domain protein [Stieleria neptunia]
MMPLLHQARAARNRRRNARTIRRQRLSSQIEQLERRDLLAFDIGLFADINQQGVSAAIDHLVEFKGEVYFVADDGRSGSELWKSDGTIDGTGQVADLLPGVDGSLPEDLTVLGAELFFTALDELGETDLWKTDGTTAGTTMVFDADANGVYYLRDLTASGGNLFFTAYHYDSGYELWIHDQAVGGTMLVKDINPDQTIIDRPRELTDVDGTLFFTSYENGYYNRELWMSDGSEAGTMMVKDLAIDTSDPLDPDPSISSYPTYLTNVDGVLFFVAEDPVDGVELFRSDGTSAGTLQVADLHPSGSSYPDDLTAFDGHVFFSADDGVTGRQLFKSQVATGTTTMVANTAGGSNASNPTDLEVVGQELFFAAEGVVPATTVSADAPTLLTDNSILSGSAWAGIVTGLTTGPDRGNLATFGGNGVFTAKPQTSTNDGPGWVVNGAKIGDAGVGLETLALNDFYLADIDSGDLDNDSWEWTISDAAGLTNLAFTGFASGNQFDQSHEGLVFELFLNHSTTRTSVLELAGDELDNWFAGRSANNIAISHPGGPTVTTATLRMTIGRDGAPAFADGGSEAIVVNATLTADLSPATTARLPVGRELHKTDGTTAGTVLIDDFVTDGSANPSELTESGGLLYFSADEPVGSGRELWVSNGTQSGTMRLIDSQPGSDEYGAPLDGDPQNLTDIGGTLFFTTIDGTVDRELWASNGTALTTRPIANINPGTQSADVQQFTPVGDLLYFVADDGINGEAVWRADPTSQTVTMVADVTASSIDAVSGLAKFGSGVVFYNSIAGSGGGMYYHDGSQTTQFMAGTPVAVNLDGTMFVENPADNRVYFVTNDAASGEELWSSDGTLAGTAIVQDLNSGNTGSEPTELTSFKGQIYFAADDGVGGRELFSTSAGGGIQQVRDINPGAIGSDPQQLTVSGGTLFFAADDGTNGRELQTSGGTLLDINPNGSSNPAELTDIGGTLYFAADNGVDGTEPFLSNGTVATQIANVGPLSSSSNPDGFTASDGRVYFAAEQSNRGALLEIFSGISGTQLVNLTGAPNYPDAPDSIALLDSFEIPTNVDNNYGARVRAYLTVPTTGDYTFWIASDDQGSLLLSTDDDPANAAQIASVPVWTSSRQYDKYPTDQQSAPIRLVAGQVYYIEALMKEGSGGDNLSVAWSGPGILGPTVIGGQYLTRFGVAPTDLGTGRELWSTDGTPAGTELVADLQPGLPSSNPEPKGSTGLRLLLSVTDDGSVGREPYSSGGTPANTSLIEDLNRDLRFGSDPEGFHPFGDDWLFVGDDGLIGNELYRLAADAPVAPDVEVAAPPGVDPPVGRQQRSMVDSISLVFDEEVLVAETAIELTNRDTNTKVTSLIVNATFRDGRTIVELTFGPGPSVVSRDPSGTTGLLNSLADGNYQLTVPADAIQSLQTGLSLDGDWVHGENAADRFFRFYGDSDGDRDVDGHDYGRFGLTFLQSAPGIYNPDLDYEGDGDVDGQDYGRFGLRFMRRLDHS